MEPLTCEAIITWVRGDYRFRPVFCGQVVATRGYWEAGARARTNTDHWVTFCSIPGHRENCERRFPAQEPEQADGMTAAKALHDREGWPA